MPLVPPYIEAMRPYEPGRSIQEFLERYGPAPVVTLCSNENPVGPSWRAVEAIRQHAEESNFYPDGGLQLRARLADQYELKIQNVIAGSGSEGMGRGTPIRITPVKEACFMSRKSRGRARGRKDRERIVRNLPFLAQQLRKRRGTRRAK